MKFSCDNMLIGNSVTLLIQWHCQFCDTANSATLLIANLVTVLIADCDNGNFMTVIPFFC